jgi:hypothetical protein
MMKQFIATVITIIIVLFSGTCSENFNEDRYVIIDVHYTLGVVSETNRLWAVVFLSPDWNGELLRFSSGTTRIIIPILDLFNLDNFTGFLAVVHDANGDGVLTGERSIGFNDIPPPPPATNILSPVPFLEIKTMVLNIDLDSGNAGPFP